MQQPTECAVHLLTVATQLAASRVPARMDTQEMESTAPVNSRPIYSVWHPGLKLRLFVQKGQIVGQHRWRSRVVCVR